MKIKRILITMVAIFVSVHAMAGDPQIDDVIVQQRWPWSRLVDIDYILKCEPEELVDVQVEAYDGSMRLTLPSQSLSGNLHSVQRGAHRIVWDPAVTAYTNSGVLSEFRVTLTPTPVPLYMIVDLTQSAGEEGQIEYVYESDLTNNLWGAWARNPVTNVGVVIESVIWTGVATNDIYKTEKLVLRRIPKGTFQMGGSTSTTLTKDFYACIFQITQGQWERIMGTNPSIYQNPLSPVESVSYDDTRGATNSVPMIDWPGTGTLVDPSSFVGALRAKTALTDFDLPTEAQWEYACQAKTTTDFNNEVPGVINPLNELGWWTGNSQVTASKTTQPVGQKKPNAWGLYDMHGNVFESCVDWHASSLTGGKDPTGAESGEKRVVRGGSFNSTEGYCKSTYRSSSKASERREIRGFRLVRTLP